jgi:hypothetical protein
MLPVITDTKTCPETKDGCCVENSNNRGQCKKQRWQGAVPVIEYGPAEPVNRRCAAHRG